MTTLIMDSPHDGGIVHVRRLETKHQGQHEARLLTDYSKFKADIDLQDEILTREPARHHRSVCGHRNSVSSGSSRYHREESYSKSVCPATFSLQSMLLQTPMDVASSQIDVASPEYTVDSDTKDSETTLESLRDPFGLDKEVRTCSDCDSTSSSSEISLCPEDLLEFDNHQSRTRVVEDDSARIERISAMAHSFYRSMPILGLASQENNNQPDMRGVQGSSNILTNDSTEDLSKSLPALMLMESIRTNNDSMRSLTDFMEAFDDQNRRRMSALNSTRATVEDLRAEMNHASALALKRHRRLPGRSLTVPGGKLHSIEGVIVLSDAKFNIQNGKDKSKKSITRILPPRSTSFVDKASSSTSSLHATSTASRHIPVRRIRRKRNNSAPGSSNPGRWHNATGYITFGNTQDPSKDHDDDLGTSGRRSVLQLRHMPRKSKSFDLNKSPHLDESIHKNSYHTSISSAFCSFRKPTTRRTLTWNTAGTSGNTSFTSSFVTGSRIKRLFPSRGEDEPFALMGKILPSPKPAARARNATRRSLASATGAIESNGLIAPPRRSSTGTATSRGTIVSPVTRTTL